MSLFIWPPNEYKRQDHQLLIRIWMYLGGALIKYDLQPYYLSIKGGQLLLDTIPPEDFNISLHAVSSLCI